MAKGHLIDDPAGDLTAALEVALGRPPSSVGHRLRTEQELANLLGLSRWRLRSALSELERRGILARRRGSGTYLRKIPASSPSPHAGSGLGSPIDPRLLFADEIETNQQRLAAKALGVGQLQIGIWCNLQTRSSTTRLVQGSIIRHLNQAGHHLTIQSSHRADDTVVNVSEIRRQLKEHQCDGYILDQALVEGFQAAAADLPGPVPVAYFGRPKGVLDHASTVGFHVSEALERAIQIFANEGFSQIGVIRGRRQDRPEAKQTHDLLNDAYTRETARHGMQYDGFASFKHHYAESVIAAMNATRQLLEREEAPDAIYVSDDHFLPGVLEAMKAAGRWPGRDIGLITMSVRGEPLLSESFQWSCLEFDVDYLGQLVVEGLLRMVQSAGASRSNLIVCPQWHAGQTHRIGPS